MPLADFGVQKPNSLAMLEMSFAILCLYKNQRQIFNEWLGTKGNYLLDLWLWRPESFPPSIAVFHDFDTGQYYCIHGGTTNALPQARAHCSGSKGTLVMPGLYEHTFFQEAALNALAEFDKVPKTNPYKVRLAGHSYGSATINIMSIRLAERIGPLNVEVLTFSEPRSVTDVGLFSRINAIQDPRAHPWIHHTICHYYDVVSRLPPQELDLLWKLPTEGATKTGNLARMHVWKRHHNATEWNFTFDHDLIKATQDDDWSLSPDAWQKTIESLHYMKTYADSSIEYHRHTVGNNDNLALQQKIRSVINLENRQPGFANPDNSPYILDSDLVSPYEDLFMRPLPQIPRSKTESYRLQALGIQIAKSGDVNGFRSNILLFGDLNVSVTNFKITQFINWGSPGACGHSESHVLKPSVTFADAQAKAIDLIYDRACLLGSSIETGGTLQINRSTPAVQYYRLSDPAKGEEAQTFDVDPLKGFGFKNRGDNQCDNPSTSLVIRLNSVNSNDASMKRRVSLILVGQSDPICKARKYDGTFKQDGTTGFSVFLKNYLDRLVGGDFGHMGQASGQAKKTVSKFEYDDTLNQWVLTVTGHSYATGEQVRLTRVNVSGFAGPYKIVVVDSNKIALAKGPSSDKPAPTAGQVQRIASANGNKLQDWYRYVNYSSLTPKISTKRVGRPFDGQTFFHKKRK